MVDASLPTFWAALIAFSLFLYIVRDGYDLGIGILFGFTRDRALRGAMVKAIAPFWDGNEVWLILVGASLFGAFPVAYAILFSAFYLPVTLMLLALIFRGISIEFRYPGKNNPMWDWGFFLGSLVASFVQGTIAGGLVQPLTVADGQYAGGAFEWLTPFSLFCGASLPIGYALLGAAWLVLKTEGELRDWSYRCMARLLLGTLTAFGLACAWTFTAQPGVANRWLGNRWLFLFPFSGVLASLGLWAGMRKRRDGIPYAMAVALFLAAFLSFAGSFWPYLIPFTVTIEAAAAPVQTLRFLFYGAGIGVFPLVLFYTAMVSWMLRGKA